MLFEKHYEEKHNFEGTFMMTSCQYSLWLIDKHFVHFTYMSLA